MLPNLVQIGLKYVLPAVIGVGAGVTGSEEIKALAPENFGQVVQVTGDPVMDGLALAATVTATVYIWYKKKKAKK